jgi:hypothetical protein
MDELDAEIVRNTILIRIMRGKAAELNQSSSLIKWSGHGSLDVC